MNVWLKLTWLETKLYLRDPSAAFFTLAFPLVLLFIYGSIYGNEVSDDLVAGKGFIDIFTPAFGGLVVATGAFLGSSSTLATYRSEGILRRYRTTPLRGVTLISSQVGVYFLVTLAGAILLFGSALLIYGVDGPQNVPALVLAVVVGTLAILELGFVLGGVAPSARAGEAIGFILFFPMIFLSGATVPRQIMPDWMQTATEAIPLTHVVSMLQDAWLHGTVNVTSMLVLIGIGIVAGVVSVRVLRWD